MAAQERDGGKGKAMVKAILWDVDGTLLDFAALPDLDKADMLLVGDSLTSDMKGGLLAGIPTCWYTPKGHPRPADMAIDHEIQDLHRVFEVI